MGKRGILVLGSIVLLVSFSVVLGVKRSHAVLSATDHHIIASQFQHNVIVPTPTPTTVPTPTPSPIPTAIPTPRPTIDPTTDAVWYALAQCESNGHWNDDTGNGYYGGLQFGLGAWVSVGGSGKPSDASSQEQIAKGKLLQARRGWSPWGACSRKLGLN